MEYTALLSNIEEESTQRIKKIHRLAKKIWVQRRYEPMDIRNKCLDRWDLLADEIDSEIVPLISCYDNHISSNLIFGSGSFSTGEFQIQQYNIVKSYTDTPPMALNGIVTNKSGDHNSNGTKIAQKYNIPYVELDFIDWYHEFIDANEPNPIRATRYWYPENDDNNPNLSQISRNFKIRQDQFHAHLGEVIEATMPHSTDSVSARGYNFQFCSQIFSHQQNHLPHINDTHPADLRYINEQSHEKLYAGWQSGAIQLMLNDNIPPPYRGSLIEVSNMDKITQIHQLDEGALLALGPGVNPTSNLVGELSARQIQNAMKISDDYLFCSLEPTGLIYLWGITKKAIPVKYLTQNGKELEIMQRAVVIGDKVYNGATPWGANLSSDIKLVENFLFP